MFMVVQKRRPKGKSWMEGWTAMAPHLLAPRKDFAKVGERRRNILGHE